jgi:hypothetical protein
MSGVNRSLRTPFSFLSFFEKKYCRGERRESRRDGGAWSSASSEFVDCLGCVVCLRRDRFSGLFWLLEIVLGEEKVRWRLCLGGEGGSGEMGGDTNIGELTGGDEIGDIELGDEKGEISVEESRPGGEGRATNEEVDPRNW